jgi:hypothetical protein
VIGSARDADWAGLYASIAADCGLTVDEARVHLDALIAGGYERVHVLTDGRIGYQFCLPGRLMPSGQPWIGPLPDAKAPVPHVPDCPGCQAEKRKDD